MNRPDISQFLAHFTSNKFPKGFKDPDNLGLYMLLKGYSL